MPRLTWLCIWSFRIRVHIRSNLQKGNFNQTKQQFFLSPVQNFWNKTFNLNSANFQPIQRRISLSPEQLDESTALLGQWFELCQRLWSLNSNAYISLDFWKLCEVWILVWSKVRMRWRWHEEHVRTTCDDCVSSHSNNRFVLFFL